MGIFDRLFGPPSRDAFAKLMLEALRKAGAPEPATYDAKTFSLSIAKNQLFYLHNVYDEYCAAPRGQRPEILKRYCGLQAAPEIPARFEDALPHILPRIRERFFYTATRLQMELQGQAAVDFAYRPFADHYAVELGYDLPQSVALIATSRLTAWDVTFDEALERSWQNLRAITNRPLEPLRPGLYVSAWRDSYDASRAMLHDFILRHRVKGEPVVALPNRDTLLLTGTQDPEGLSKMAQEVEKAMAGPRPMTALPLVLSERSYSSWMPDPDHPCHRSIKLLTLRSLGAFYAEEKQLLEALHEKTGLDVYVGAFTVTRADQTGDYSTYCVWSQGVDTWLPEADQVAFVRAGAGGKLDPGAPPVVAPWSRVRDVVGTLMEPLGSYPPRYRVRGFPSGEQLTALGAAV